MKLDESVIRKIPIKNQSICMELTRQHYLHEDLNKIIETHIPQPTGAAERKMASYYYELTMMLRCHRAVVFALLSHQQWMSCYRNLKVCRRPKINETSSNDIIGTFALRTLQELLHCMPPSFRQSSCWQR